MTGIPREEALGTDKFLLQPNLLKQDGPGIIARIFETNQISTIPGFPYELKDGTVRYLDLTFLPSTTDDGEVTAIILFAQDVTRFKSLRPKNTNPEP